MTSILFITFIAIIGGALHYYLWIRLVRDTSLPSFWNRFFSLAILFLALGIPVSFFIGRLFAPKFFQFIAYPIFIWIGLLFLCFVLLLSVDVLKLISWVTLKFTHNDLSAIDTQRRIFMARLAAGTVAASALTAGLFGIRKAMAQVKIRRLRIPLKKLPKELDGFTIVQLTDLHLGAPLGRNWLEEIVEQTNKLKPDLIAITGDLVDGPLSALKETVASLANLRASSGVFFVTGNHEYFSGVDEWIAEITRLGIHVLRNERVSVGKGSASFDLAGIDDHDGRRFAPGHGPDLKKALAKRDTTRELVLLAHQPKAIFEAANVGVGLQLSGHTHGGQIWPFNFLIRLQQPYVSGLVQHGPTTLYVSEGTGYWGPPMRLGTSSEISVFELKAAG